jgi:hypothetical protein
MAVAVKDCMIIARSVNYATVTPFSADLPVTEIIEIGDVCVYVCFDYGGCLPIL